MKISLILFLLLGLISCREEEGIWDKLTPDERTALRERARTKCVDESNAYFDDLITRSGDRFYGSGGYVAGTTFNHTFKEGSAVDYTHKITVWKVTATDVYLLIAIDDSTDEYRFLKIPKTTNDAMFASLQTKHCDKSDTGQADGFTLNTSAKTYTQIREGSSSTKDLTYTFTYSSTLLAYLSLYKESRKEQPLDSNGNATGTATTLTGTLSNSTTETNIPKFDTYAEYVATGIATTLCIINSTYAIPYTLVCDPTGVTSFPSSEL